MEQKGISILLPTRGRKEVLKKSLESFSFKDLIMDIVKAPFNLVSKACIKHSIIELYLIGSMYTLKALSK